MRTVWPEGKRSMAVSSWYFAAVACVLLLAGGVKGVIGFSLPTVSVGLLSLLMTPAQAAAIVVVPALVTNIWQFIGSGILALLRRMWPITLGICIGTPIGVVFLPSGESRTATIWLGAALVIYGGLGLFKIEFSVPASAERWLGLIVGMATGAVTVATGVFVIPAVPYIQALNFERDELVRALGLSFTTSTITLALALAHAGDIRMGLASSSLIALPAALVGMALGRFVRGKVRPQTFRLCLFIGLLALGLNLALRELL